MTPDRWQQLQELYHAARTRPEDARAAFLDAACVGDEPLRCEVESLLAQQISYEAFLGASAIVVAEENVSRPEDLPLTGRRIGAYEIQTLLGAGGMGEVYLARDTRLGRDVAIKILPRTVTGDPERRARFEREARMLASLNHPHIGAIYGVEEVDGAQALVLELVEGPTLADRLQRGPVPVTEALTIARQIADALDAAHEKGIIHRDLKPANIKVTPDCRVKVLDFGLAKVTSDGLTPDLTQSPTVTVGGTRDGIVLGTAAYMSPEQARGQAVDKRADIWAFGCVLYEMLTGDVTFPGETVSDTIAAILRHEPDWAALPATTPPLVARLLRRSLEKDPKRRLRDIAVASALAGWSVRRLNPAPDNPLSNATFTRLTNFEGDEAQATLSPDGKFATFLSDRDGPLDVWLTQVGSGRFVNLTRESHMPGLRPVRNIGFSGDGSEIWFGGAPVGRMRILPMMGGPPRPFLVDRAVEVVWSSDGARMVYHTDAPGDPMFVADRTGVGATQIFVDPIAGGHNHHQAWSPDGRWIYFARGSESTRQMDFWRIAASGGQPERLTSHNAYVGFPTPIDDRHVLYIAQDHDGSGPWLWALDTNSRATRRVAYGTEQYLSIAGSADHRQILLRSVRD